MLALAAHRLKVFKGLRWLDTECEKWELERENTVLRGFLTQADHKCPLASMPHAMRHLVPFPLFASFYSESGLGNFFSQESFLCVELFQLEWHYCSERSPKVSGEDLLALSRFDTSLLRSALPKISKVKWRTKSSSPASLWALPGDSTGREFFPSFRTCPCYPINNLRRIFNFINMYTQN